MPYGCPMRLIRDKEQSRRLLAGTLVAGGLFLTSLAFALPSDAIPFMKEKTDENDQLAPPDPVPKVKLTKEQQAEFTQSLQNGQTYLKQGSFDMAKICFDHCISLDPNSIDARMGRAICLNTENQLEAAGVEIIEVLRNVPQHAEARFLFGEIMMKDSRWDEAGGQFLQILKTDPNNLAARGNLALCLQQMHQFDAAIGQYKYVLEKNPKSCEAAYNLGGAYESKKWLDEAIFYYKKAVEINPNYYNGYCSLAKCLAGKKQYEDAITLLAHAVKMNPKNHYAFLVKGYVYQCMGDKRKAIEAYTKAVALNPQDWDSKRSLQKCLESGHEKELAGLRKLQPH